LELKEAQMIRDNAALLADPVEFDEDYYVIDEPPAFDTQPPVDPMDYRVVREQRLQLAAAEPAPHFQVYWTVPLTQDVDWDDED
jgi:hypothetical protein